MQNQTEVENNALYSARAELYGSRTLLGIRVTDFNHITYCTPEVILRKVISRESKLPIHKSTFKDFDVEKRNVEKRRILTLGEDGWSYYEKNDLFSIEISLSKVKPLNLNTPILGHDFYSTSNIEKVYFNKLTDQGFFCKDETERLIRSFEENTLPAFEKLAKEHQLPTVQDYTLAEAVREIVQLGGYEKAKIALKTARNELDREAYRRIHNALSAYEYFYNTKV